VIDLFPVDFSFVFAVAFTNPSASNIKLFIVSATAKPTSLAAFRGNLSSEKKLFDECYTYYNLLAKVF